MLKLIKIAGAVLVAGVLLFAVCLFALYHLIQTGELRQLLIREFEERTGAKVSIGEVGLAIGTTLEGTFRDFALSERDREVPLMTADRVVIRLALAPLLERRLVFQEVRFSHPLVKLEKDEAGNIPSLSILSRLFFPSEPKGNLKLDLREIRIEKGGILLRDQKRPDTGFIFQFRETDLRLRLIPFSPGKPLFSVPPTPRWEANGLALDFTLDTTIEKAGDIAKFASKGKLYFPEGALNIRRAWVDADVSADAIPVNLLWEHFDFLPPLKAVRGTVAPRLHWQGNLAEQGRMQGKIDFKQLALEAPEFLTQRVTPGDGQTEFELEWTPRQVRISRWDLRSQEIAFEARGVSLSRAEDDLYLEGQLQTPFLSLPTAQKYFPRQLVASPRWGPWLKTWNQGEFRVTQARFQGRFSEFQQFSKPGQEDRLEFDLELKGAGETQRQDRRPSFKEMKGHVALEKGVLYFRGLSGFYGQSRLVEINGSQKGVLTDHPLLELRVQGEIALNELQEGLMFRFLPARLSKNAGFLKDSAGRGQIKLSFRTDFATLQHLDGQLLLDQARLRMGDFSLTQIKGNLLFSTNEAHAEGATALLSGSPVTIGLALKNYLTEEGTFDLTLESPNAKAGVATRLLLSAGSLDDPGTVRGAIRYQGSIASNTGRRLTGSLEFSGAQLSLLKDPLRDVSGQLSLNGDSIDFKGFKGYLAGTGFDFSGQWKDGGQPQMVFTLNLAETDLGALLAQIDEGTHEWYNRLQAKGRVTIQKGRYEGFHFSDLVTDLALDKRLWRLENFSARSTDGTIQGKGDFLDQPQGLHFSVGPKIQAVPVQEFLSWFDLGTTEISGRINLTGNLESTGKKGPERKRNLNGAFRLEIEDGTVRRFRLLVLIMNFLDLSRWFTLQMPDINKEGIRFRSITGDFKVSQGVYSTQNLLVDSDDLRITGVGKVDAPKGDIDFVIAVRPFPGLDTAVNFIPLIGPGIAAIKNSLLVASFRLTGSIESPIIVPAPLSTLSEFFYGALAIPRSLIVIPGLEKK